METPTTKFIVSATSRDAEPEAIEVPWTKQLVESEEQAQRLCVARNRLEKRLNGPLNWGYYPATATTSDGGAS